MRDPDADFRSAVHGAIGRILHDGLACDAAKARIAFALAAVIICKESAGIDRVGVVWNGNLEMHVFEHRAADLALSPR